jgi:hypothetical protein
MNHQQDDADDEENPRDLRRDGGHTCGTKDTGDQPDDKKYESVIQHCDTSLSGVIKHTVCRCFCWEKTLFNTSHCVTPCRRLLQPQWHKRR